MSIFLAVLDYVTKKYVSGYVTKKYDEAMQSFQKVEKRLHETVVIQDTLHDILTAEEEEHKFKSFNKEPSDEEQLNRLLSDLKARDPANAKDYEKFVQPLKIAASFGAAESELRAKMNSHEREVIGKVSQEMASVNEPDPAKKYQIFMTRLKAYDPAVAEEFHQQLSSFAKDPHTAKLVSDICPSSNPTAAPCPAIKQVEAEIAKR